MKKIIFIAILFLIGCSSQQKEKPELLQQAQKLHQEVSLLQGNPEENIIRHDWLPWYYEEYPVRTYLYTVPYIPFWFHNQLITYSREIVFAPTWIFTGGTEYQDQADQFLVNNELVYEDVFKTFWPSQDSHANFVNMDEWEFQDFHQIRRRNEKK